MGSVYYFGFVKQGIIPSGDYIQVPTIYWFSCEPAKEPVTGDWNNIYKEGSWLTCPENTDICDIDVGLKEKPSWYTNVYLYYNICSKSGTCEGEKNLAVSSSYEVTKTFYNIRQDQKVKVYFYDRVVITGGYYDKGRARANYKPFILWKTSLFSGKTEYTTMEQGCNFPSYSKDTNKIISLVNSVTNSKQTINQQTSTENSKLTPYKTRNFIDQYIPISVENVNFVTYNGRQGYCLNRQIFAISEIQTSSGTYKIVDSNFNTLISPSVDCCPNEKQPGYKCENFDWVPIEVAQCSSFNPCAGVDWMPSSSKTLIRYNCVNSKCVSETKNVECTIDADCINSGKGKYCDTKTWKCSGIPDVNVSKVEICDNNIDDDGNGKIDLDDPACKKEEGCGYWTIIPGWGEVEYFPDWDGLKIPDLWCHINLFVEKIKWLFATIIGILGGVWGGFVTNMFVKKKKLKQKWWILLIPSILVGISLGILAYVFFWWILLALILLGIISGILKFYVPGV